MGSRVFSRWAGEGLRILFALASIALLATLASPRRGHADEYVLDFGVDVPQLATFSPRLAIVGTSTTVDTELRAEFDQRGKLGGTGTVDGVPVVLTGRLKQTKSEWNAKLLVRNARSTNRRVKLKVTGRVGAGPATAQGHIDGRAVESLGDAQLQSVANSGGGTLTITVLEKEPGKIVGIGILNTGLVTPFAGAIVGKMTHKTLTLKFSSGKKKAEFKGKLVGNRFEGTLKIVAVPVKLTTPASLGGNGVLSPHAKEKEEKEKEKEKEKKKEEKEEKENKNSGSNQNTTMTLQWDPVVENYDGTETRDLAGYRVYEGRESRHYTTVTEVGRTTQFTLKNLKPGVYFIAVSAYDKHGNESVFSDEIVVTIGAPEA